MAVCDVYFHVVMSFNEGNVSNKAPLTLTFIFLIFYMGSTKLCLYKLTLDPVHTRVGIRCFRWLDLSLITKELKQSVTILWYILYKQCYKILKMIFYFSSIHSGIQVMKHGKLAY